ncbi:MAG TPA: hypothetical protein VM680_09160 [Verrucomicrobiae bacterium]|nr:hypothetical protein [Verrucomicrobiae bacterium]
MKTKIITATTLALVAASNVQTSMAGDREWATAGKVLTGIAAASIISRALEPRPTVVYAPAPTTVVYQTVPVTTTAVVTSQPVYTTTTIPVATVPDAPTIPNAPMVGQQTVVVQQPATVVYEQPQVVYAPAPPPTVVYAPAPVYYAPPRVSFGVVFGGGYHHHHGHHGRRW